MINDPGELIAAAFAMAEEDRYREQQARARKALSMIMSGTRDEDLTDEQRQAWTDFEEATAWLEEVDAE